LQNLQLCHEHERQTPIFQQLPRWYAMFPEVLQSPLFIFWAADRGSAVEFGPSDPPAFSGPLIESVMVYSLETAPMAVRRWR